MHDVDRTVREFENEFAETESYETEAQENESFLGGIVGNLFGETESQEQGFLGETGETQETGEAFLGEQGFLGESNEAYETQGEGTNEAVFDEVQEMELAAELLEVSNEAELEQFLGKLVKGAAKAIGGVVRGPVGKALGPVLKQVAKTALPMAGAALGNLVLPGVGGAIGGKLASAAGNLFGLELEGMSPQDREFEVARRFVRLAGATTQRAVRTPPRIPPRQAVRSAVITSARRHAPGLLRPRPAVRRAGVRRPAAQGGVQAPTGVTAPVFQPGALSGRGRRPRPIVGGPTYVGGAWYDAPADYGATVPSTDTPSYTSPPTDMNATLGYGTGTGYAPSSTSGRSGRWYRRGNKIIIVGL